MIAENRITALVPGDNETRGGQGFCAPLTPLQAGAVPPGKNVADRSQSMDTVLQTAPSTPAENRRISARLRETVSGISGRRMPEVNEEEQADRKETSASRTTEEPADAVRVRLAETAFEHLEAFHLVYEQYESFGYDGSRINRLRVQPWNLTVRSHTIIAEINKRIIGTVTCLEDGPGGLPADKIYPDEMRQLREKGRSLVEVSSFAVEPCADTDLQTALKTLRAAVTYMRKILKATDWVCTVNPRHERFYVKVLLLDKAGGDCRSVAVNNAPTVFLRLDLVEMPERYAQKYMARKGLRNLYEFFFEPLGEDRRLVELWNAHQKRLKHWSVTQKALALLQE